MAFCTPKSDLGDTDHLFTEKSEWGCLLERRNMLHKGEV